MDKKHFALDENEKNFDLTAYIQNLGLTLRKKKMKNVLTSKRKLLSKKFFQDIDSGKFNINVPHKNKTPQDLLLELTQVTTYETSGEELNNILYQIFLSIQSEKKEDIFFLLQNNILFIIKNLIISQKGDLDLILSIIINLFSPSDVEIQQYSKFILQTDYLDILYYCVSINNDETNSNSLWILSNIFNENFSLIYDFFVTQERFIYRALSLCQSEENHDSLLVEEVARFLYMMTEIGNNNNLDKEISERSLTIIKLILESLINIFIKVDYLYVNILRYSIAGITKIIQMDQIYYNLISPEISEISPEFLNKIIEMKFTDKDSNRNLNFDFLKLLEQIGIFLETFCLSSQGSRRMEELLKNNNLIKHMGTIFGFLQTVDEEEKNCKDKIIKIKILFLTVVLRILETSKELAISISTSDLIKFLQYLIQTEQSEGVYLCLVTIVLQFDNYKDDNIEKKLMDNGIYGLLFQRFYSRPSQDKEILKKLYFIYYFLLEYYGEDSSDWQGNVEINISYFEEYIKPNYDFVV